MQINQNFDNIAQSYLFSTVAKKQREFQAAHPEADVIKLSIGDVTRPLAVSYTHLDVYKRQPCRPPPPRGSNGKGRCPLLCGKAPVPVRLHAVPTPLPVPAPLRNPPRLPRIPL